MVKKDILFLVHQASSFKQKKGCFIIFFICVKNGTLKIEFVDFTILIKNQSPINTILRKPKIRAIRGPLNLNFMKPRLLYYVRTFHKYLEKI